MHMTWNWVHTGSVMGGSHVYLKSESNLLSGRVSECADHLNAINTGNTPERHQQQCW